MIINQIISTYSRRKNSGTIKNVSPKFYISFEQRIQWFTQKPLFPVVDRNNTFILQDHLSLHPYPHTLKIVLKR
jgi:hypothetical protein